MSKNFDYKITDSQATAVTPVAPENFPYEEYARYERERREACREFRASSAGVLVYRRMRVGECFSAGCANYRRSLELQLGALQAGMAYAADVPNFLEPWYGIGTVASAFGSEYVWKPGQAPAVMPIFRSANEALDGPIRPVSEAGIGRKTLAMIDYFLGETGGRLPMSLTDTQSPLNIAAMIVDVSSLLMNCMDTPHKAQELFGRIARLQIDFVRAQQARIGDALVWPGHGFASCREFAGLGQSDDNVLMFSNEMYAELAAPSFRACADPFGGAAFHSCGNWAGKLPVIRELPGLRTVDAAFGAATDPCPNQPEPFAEALAGTGIVLNARIVGDPDTVLEQVRRLWRPDLKLIVVTYCETPAQQAETYKRIKELCI